MSIIEQTLWAPSLATRRPQHESPTPPCGIETLPRSTDNLSLRLVPRHGPAQQYLHLVIGRKEKATGTAFSERNARDGMTSGLDRAILSHRDRRRKGRAGASGSRTRTRWRSSPFVGPPNRPSAVLITRSGASGKGSFEKATGTAFDERDARGGMNATLTGRSYHTRSGFARKPGWSGRESNPQRRSLSRSPSEPPNRPSAVLITRADAFGKGSFEKATGTAFDERDALSGVTGDLDAMILPYRGRRRNAELCSSRAGLHSVRVRLKKATGTAFGKRDALSGATTGLDTARLSHRDRRRNAGLVDHAISANRKAPS